MSHAEPAVPSPGAPPMSQRHAGTGNDRNDTLQLAGLAEDLDRGRWRGRTRRSGVVAADDAMRMAAVARGEQAGRVGHGIVHDPATPPHCRSQVPVASEHDDAVIAVAVGDVDAAALTVHRVRIRIDPHVGRLVQQRLALVGQGLAPSCRKRCRAGCRTRRAFRSAAAAGCHRASTSARCRRRCRRSRCCPGSRRSSHGCRWGGHSGRPTRSTTLPAGRTR